MAFLKVIIIALEVVLLFNLLIFVHELGHFLAAKWRGLKVDRFAIWFGKPIWSTKIGGVEYALGWIPAGGYVSLPQMATMETIEGKTEERSEPLPPVSALDKIIVAFAGPLFSFLLAIAMAFIVMSVGRPVSEAEGTTTIGYLVEDGPAAKAGLKPGDKILEVDGEPVSKFGGMGDSVTWRIVRSVGETVQIKVNRNGETLEFFPKPMKEETKAWERKSLRQIGVAPSVSAVVAEVVAGSPAAKAGLKLGDQVVSVNGQTFHHFSDVSEYIQAQDGQPVNFVFKRSGKEFAANIQPEIPTGTTNKEPRIGVMWNATGAYTLVYPGAIQQVKDSVRAMIDTFGALFDRKTSISPQHLGGAVKIMDVYARLFSAEHGWRLALWFSVLMNVNLAILNMLPIPVLDGGHITLSIIEGIRRKPISHRVGNIIQTTCAVLLIGFMIYIAFYDVQDLPWKRWLGKEKTEAIQFSPATNAPAE
jgi:regulator of sigma E protease